MSRKEIVLQIQMLMRRLFPTAEVILYGSEARNEARPDSDDLTVQAKTYIDSLSQLIRGE